MEDYYVPGFFKTAVVTPLIKKAILLADDLKKYHLVSGLSFILKLIEQAVAKKLLDHIHVHNLENLSQSAYKTGYSTETTLLPIKRISILVKSRTYCLDIA